MYPTSFAIRLQLLRACIRPLVSSKYRFNSSKCFFLALICLVFSEHISGQCTDFIQVDIPYGTQNLGCTTVEINAAGAAHPWAYACGLGPYKIGDAGTGGSYTFTFSPPVQEVKVDVTSLDNHQQTSFHHIEEVLFDINGAFYPLSAPGSGTTPCWPPAVVTSGGALIAEPGYTSTEGYAETRDLIFPQTISSLKITDSIMSGFPHGVILSVYVCCTCNTDAGNIASGPLSACVPSQISLPESTQTFLYSDDLLQYILFSNPANPTGSIVATANTPDFSFNPATMQADQTYYVAAIAGHGDSGNIDLTDPCLDLSNVIEVLWHGRPAVTFSVSNPNVCAGACATVTAHFTGTAPFTLSYTSSLTGPATEIFTGNSGSFSICPPGNAPGGALVVSATSLVDGVCSCP
jgi:hypothetical protein